MDDLPFVTGAFWHRSRDVTVQTRVRERLRKNRPPPGSGGGKSSNDSKDAAARLLTSKIKQAKSATELLDLLDEEVDGPIFNKFHASAAYHSLATWRRNGGLTPRDKESPVLRRLAARVQNMALKGELGPRQVSNVFWSLGQLFNDLGISKGLLMALVKSLGEKASGMKPQELSNSLLACVQLKGVAPEVLTVLPELAAQISIKAKDMDPQALSNSLWASAQLKEDACHEDVAKLVAASCSSDPRQSKRYDPPTSLQHFVGCSSIKGCCTGSEGDSASHRGADPRQGKWHETTRTLQQFVGRSSLKGHCTGREGDSARHCGPDPRQSKRYDPPTSLQQFVGRSSIKGHCTRREGDGASHLGPDPRQSKRHDPPAYLQQFVGNSPPER